MAIEEQLAILKQGVDAWNKWRQENLDVRVDLTSANLNHADLTGVDFYNAHLANATFVGTKLNKAKLVKASGYKADFRYARFNDSNLTIAVLTDANLSYADLNNVNLESAYLAYADLGDAELNGANFNNAYIMGTIFRNNDLSLVKGLDNVVHHGPSSIDIETLYISEGKIPESFLRGCGVPDDLINFISSHFKIQRTTRYYSCFISYSHKDEMFAKRLHSRLRDAHIRVWFAPENIRSGEKVFEQIDRGNCSECRIVCCK